MLVSCLPGCDLGSNLKTGSATSTTSSATSATGSTSLMEILVAMENFAAGAKAEAVARKDRRTIDWNIIVVGVCGMNYDITFTIAIACLLCHAIILWRRL